MGEVFESEQPDYSDGTMLAIYPPPDIAAALALPGGLDPNDLHVTVAYTGTTADTDAQDLIAAALDAARTLGPFTAHVSGSARFTGGEQDVLVALIDAPELEDLRRATLDALAAHGIEVPRQHGYTPHLSRIYLEPDEPDPAGRLAPLTFLVGSLSVVHGAVRADIPLNTKAERAQARFAARAREAYAEGWARSGGPMTERVRAGCTAAVAMACEHRHEPGVLEATLKLGSLEGVWALVYRRRDELIAKHAAAMQSAWRDATAALDAHALVREVRAALGLEESADQGAVQRAKQAARDAALRLLAWLPATAAWQTLRDTMRAALRSGRAEGAAGAIAIAGEAAGRIGIDFDLAFQDAYDALANLGQLWADADGWLAKTVGRAADEMGRALGDLAANGAGYGEMLDAASGILDGADGDAVAFVTDWALSTGLGQGALSLYAGEGVAEASWISAGDGRVCPVCQDNEDNSPYLLGDFPSLPGHPRCRCAATAEWALPASYSRYFTD
ncbi:MAG TPA: 2'-5' RNA ligase family protein [Polyangia bacterium]|nr:2'-5' RNA ligase family protein [Polyangia bacterium]